MVAAIILKTNALRPTGTRPYFRVDPTARTNASNAGACSSTKRLNAAIRLPARQRNAHLPSRSQAKRSTRGSPLLEQKYRPDPRRRTPWAQSERPGLCSAGRAAARSTYAEGPSPPERPQPLAGWQARLSLQPECVISLAHPIGSRESTLLRPSLVLSKCDLELFLGAAGNLH